jgi:hypothetical protein
MGTGTQKEKHGKLRRKRKSFGGNTDKWRDVVTRATRLSKQQSTQAI